MTAQGKNDVMTLCWCNVTLLSVDHSSDGHFVKLLSHVLCVCACVAPPQCDNPYDTRFRPERLLLYDKHPGGIGLVAQVRAL